MILEATAALLDEMPLERITTARIAERAGVPIGSVYQYFPNKLSIVAALARNVMEEVDAQLAAQVADDFGVLPWDEAVDHTVDLVIRAYSEQPGYAQVLRTLRPTQEFRVITEESNKRVAALFAAHPAIEAMVPAERLEIVTRSAVEAANALQDWALSTEDPTYQQGIVEEMKTLLKAYLAHQQKK